jgi:hypothetical protein
VIEARPTGSADVVHVAIPPLSGWALQSVMLSSPTRKVTVPVGVPVPGAVAETVAVNVTGLLDTDGFSDGTLTVVVAAFATVWVIGVASLGR